MKASLVFLLIALCAMAQPARQLVHSDGRVRRIALVIGNDAYPEKRLHNAANDARSMKSALEEAGFTVQIRVDATQQQMENAIDDFTGSANPGDIALFFYAGHGMQINDQNYLIPVDFQARTAVDAKYKAYPAQRVQENLEAAGTAMQILAMDACRNNPFRSWRGGSEGLAPMQAGRGTYIAFATSPGKTAADNPEGKNGLFTGVLVDVLREPGLNIDQVFTRVRDQVYRKSHGQQLPWSTSSVTGEFYFKVAVEGSVSIPPRESSAAPPRDLSGERELAFWNSIKDENDAALLEEYLRTYPGGAFASIAKAKLNRLKAAASPPVRVAETGTQSAQEKNGTFSETQAQIDRIIGKFAAKEAEFSKARLNYTYRQSVKLQELDESGGPLGKWEIVSDIVFTPAGNRVEREVQAPVQTLKRLTLTPEDMQDLRDVQPFVLTTAEIPFYEIRYLGRQKLDELSCYEFAIKPVKMEKGKRYFEGTVWVDDEDLQIVKTFGRGIGVLGERTDNQFPKFETYREQIDGKYWFPTYTIANDTLQFKHGSQRIRMSVRYENYRMFKSE